MPQKRQSLVWRPVYKDTFGRYNPAGEAWLGGDLLRAERGREGKKRYLWSSPSLRGRIPFQTNSHFTLLEEKNGQWKIPPPDPDCGSFSAFVFESTQKRIVKARPCSLVRCTVNSELIAGRAKYHMASRTFHSGGTNHHHGQKNTFA